LAVIKHTEIFDFPAYTQAIKEAGQLSTDFEKVWTNAIKRIRVQQKQLLAELKEYREILNKFNTSTTGASQGLGAYNKQVSAAIRGMNELKAVSAGMASIVNLQKASIAELKAEYSGVKKQLDALKPGQADYNEQLGRLQARLREIAPRIKEYNAGIAATTKVVNHAEGSYKALQAQLGQLRTRLREMPNAFDNVTGKINRNNRAAVDLNKEIQRLDRVMKGADKSMGIYYRNVGNYASALNGFGGNISSFAAQLFSITAAVGLVTKSLDVSSRFQSLNTAIEALSTTSTDFAQNQAFLQRLAKDYGQDIFVLTNSYKGLLATTQGTNLEGEKTRNIFESVVKASTVLRLSNEQLEGSLLAIQQMMSKGNIQAEELRGQLSERLPVAFRVMARAVGTTTEGLNEMLKNGEVIAEDVLPKFAEELNKMYSDDAVKNATALVNEQNRLNNAWNELMNSEKVLGFFSTVYKGLARFVADLNYTIKSGEWGNFFMDANEVTKRREQSEKQARSMAGYLTNLEKATEKERQSIIQGRVDYIKRAEGELKNLYGDARVQAEKAIAAQREQLTKELELLGRVTVQNELAAASGDKKSKKQIAADNKALAAFKKRVDTEQGLLEKAYQNDLDDLQFQLDTKQIKEKEYQEQKLTLTSEYAGAAYAKEIELGANANQEKLAGFKNMVEAQKREAIKAAMEAEDEIAERLNEKRGVRQVIDENAFKPNNGYVNPFSDQVAGAAETATANKEAAAQREIDAQNKAFDVIRAGRDTSFREELGHLQKLKDIKKRYAQDTADEDYAIAQLNAERKRALEQQTAEFVMMAVSTALNALQDSSNAKFEARIAQLETEKAAQLEAAGQNAAAREQIEKQYNQRIAREKRRQAQSEKRFALFNVGINTAQGVMKSIAQWGMPFALPFIALTVATGLIQAAAIASKPLPALRKGAKSAKPGLTLVGEAGRELVDDKRGNAYMVDKPTLMVMKGGERVYNNDETEKLAAQALRQEEINQVVQQSLMVNRATKDVKQASKEDTVAAFATAFRQAGLPALPQAIREAIKDLPVSTLAVDERGFTRGVRRRNELTEYLSKRHR
jgi:tape measure domain-containing protein